MINKKLFANADLNGSYRLVYTHNLNTQDVLPTLYDNDSIQVITSDNFSLGDETGNDKDNIVTLNLNNPITGTWKLLLNYQGASETTSGRRAFELGTGTPSDDSRLIFGKAATPSLNILLSAFYTLLMSKLTFLKKDENLNDLTDKSQARTNLGVYDTIAVDNALSGKASLYQSGSGSVLGVANTGVYEPTTNYHPATKLYADRGLASGSNSLGDFSSGDWKEVVVTIGVTLSNTNYKVLGEVYDTSGDGFVWFIKLKTTTQFTIRARANSSGTVEASFLNWKILPL
jgi:hypothetical protein